MPVIRKEPPDDVREAVNGALRQFAQVPAAQLHALEGTTVSALRAEDAHAVFNLGLSDLKTGTLATAKSVGWRFLLREDGRAVASAETATRDAGPALFSHFNRGPFVESTAAALEGAEASTPRDASFEPRLLHIPALYTMVLWFHHDGGKDVYVPLAPTPDGIEAGRSYSAEELLPILKEMASHIPDMGPGDTRGG